MTTCLRISKLSVRIQPLTEPLTQINRLIPEAAPWCHQVDSFWNTQLIMKWQIILELEHLWPAHAQNCRLDTLHSYTLDARWILRMASLMLLELLSSLTPTCDFSLRKLPVKAFMTSNMGTYLLFYYILRESMFLILSVCTFKRLILFPREVHLKGEKLAYAIYMLPMCCFDVWDFLELISYLTIQNINQMALGQLDTLIQKANLNSCLGAHTKIRLK